MEQPQQGRTPAQGGDAELHVVAPAGRVDRAAAQEEAAQYRLAVAGLLGQGPGGRLREHRLQAGGDRELDEEGHLLGALDRLVLGLDAAHHARQADDLARHRVAQEREVGGLADAGADDPASGGEDDAKELADLAAGSRRRQPRKLGFYLSGE